MTSVKLLIRTDEYLIKTLKPSGNSTIIHLPKKYAGKEILCIPLVNSYTIREAEDGSYSIVLNATDMILKEVKQNAKGAYVYLPTRYFGYECLICMYE